MTSVSWAPYAEALAGRDVYAIDIMGDAGRSEPCSRLADGADMAAWLDETLVGLDIEQAQLVGHSLGGFVALTTAARRPARVSSLVLLDPLGIAPLRMLRFMLWGLPVLLGSLAPAPVRRWLGRWLRNPLLENKRASRLILHGMVGHAPGFPLFKPLQDDELAAVTAPVALLIGAKCEPFDVGVLAARAEAHMPRVTIELVPEAGHALTVSHLAICAAAIERTAT
jgi:pimeloyl-ACP methyl ester carboxylesterase